MYGLVGNVRTFWSRLQRPNGKRARKVPLWWDAGTLADLDSWKRERTAQGAKPDSPFVCCLNRGKHIQTGRQTIGQPLAVRNLQARWKAATKCLGTERVRQLSIHAGRHSFCSHSIAGGRNLIEVRDAVGHASLTTTNLYAHLARDVDEEVGDLFSFSC